jgi:hypothetical protein
MVCNITDKQWVLLSGLFWIEEILEEKNELLPRSKIPLFPFQNFFNPREPSFSESDLLALLLNRHDTCMYWKTGRFSASEFENFEKKIK